MEVKKGGQGCPPPPPPLCSCPEWATLPSILVEVYLPVGWECMGRVLEEKDI